MTDYAEITGVAFRPGTSDPMWAEISARPLVEGYGLVLDGGVSKGPVVVQSDESTGEFTLPVPILDGVVWRLRMREINGTDTTTWHMGDTLVTEDVAIEDIVTTTPTAVTDDLVDSILTARDQVLAVPATTAGLMASVDADDNSDFREQLDARLAASFASDISPFGYGAVGDNTTDDKTGLQAAINAAAAFGVPLDLHGRTYRTTDTLALPAGSKIQNGRIRCTGTGRKILNLTGDNIRLTRVSIEGRHSSATAAANEYGVFAEGASAASPLRGIVLEECSVELVGMYGVCLKFVDGFGIRKCELGDLGYTGIGTLSCKNGAVENCRVEDVLASATFSSNGYGMHFSRADETTDSLTTSPRSSDITVINNIVLNVPWEGIDTHAGERITFTKNHVLGCKVGIAAVGSRGTGGVIRYAPQQVTIVDNTIDSLVTDGSAGAGVSFAGAQGATSADVAVEYATGTVVSNIVRNHGTQSDNTLGAMYFRSTRGVIVANNRISQPSPFGIMAYYDNRGLNVFGNTVTDAWSTSVTVPAAIATRADNNTGSIAGNTMLTTGEKSATYLNVYGLYNSGGGTGTDVIVGINNNFTAAGTSGVSSATGVFATKDPFRAPAGSAASPSISLAGDPDTGLYSVGADQLGIAAGGSLVGRFLTTGLLMAVGKITAAAAVTGSASVRLPHGAVPTAPVDGDMWTTTAGLFVRINGATVGPLS